MLCAFITDLVPAKNESGKCLYWNIRANMQSIEREVVLPCYSVILEPYVVPLHQQYYCSQDRASWVSALKFNGEYTVDRKKLVSPCCSVMPEPNVVLLHHRSCCSEEWAWWVSVLRYNGEYAVDRKGTCLTVLFCSAWARCCAPSAPILFDQRLRLASAYIEI